jgi:cytochrome c
VRRILLTLALLSPVAGCATSRAPASTAPPAIAAADRGLFFVLRSCAGCHAVGSLGESPNGVAPSFAKLRLRYNELSLERRLADISVNGHFEMPPIYMTPDEIKAISAYVQTIGPPSAAAPQQGRTKRGVAD